MCPVYHGAKDSILTQEKKSKIFPKKKGFIPKLTINVNKSEAEKRLNNLSFRTSVVSV